MKGIIHVLTGPTAVGKTELALRWAEANDAEIVSCDALLFYHGMDIGTAKPTAAERARVPHHLILTCSLSERNIIDRDALAPQGFTLSAKEFLDRSPISTADCYDPRVR